MTSIGTFRPSQQEIGTKTLPIKLKHSILNADFFLRYLHSDAKASSYIVKRLGIDKDKSHITLMTESLDTTLERYIESYPLGLSLEKTGFITKKITEALDFLDESDVVYPNLIPKSIHLSSDGKTVKLAHFEQAHFNDDPHFPLKYKIKTSYQSPETILGVDFTLAPHIWALGLIVNKMFTRTFYDSETKKNIIAFHQFFLGKPYPEDLVKESPHGEKIYQNSMSIDLGLSETLEQTVRRVSNLKQEDPEKAEEFLSLLLEMLKYTNRPTAKELLEHPFLQRFASGTIEVDPAQSNQNHVLIRNFSWGALLGEGVFGSIFEGIIDDNGTQKTYAVKINKEDLEAKEDLLREDRLLRLLQKKPEAKDYIIQRFKIMSFSNNQFGLFLEKMSCNLNQYIKRQKTGLSLEKTHQFAKQILKGLQVLSDADIIHLDVKPINILVSLDGEILKIADFGYSCFQEAACLPDQTYLQTRWYRSPESILEIPLTPACDIWSFGAIIPEIFTNRAIFQGSSAIEMVTYHQTLLNRLYPQDFVAKGSKNGQDTFKQVKPNTSPQTLNQFIRENAHIKNENRNQVKLFIDLMEKALEYDPSKRQTPRQLLDHPFLKEEVS